MLQDGKTALIWAAWALHDEAVRFLLESGADIDTMYKVDKAFYVAHYYTPPPMLFYVYLLHHVCMTFCPSVVPLSVCLWKIDFCRTYDLFDHNILETYFHTFVI